MACVARSVSALFGIRPRRAVVLRPSPVEASSSGPSSTLHYLIAVRALVGVERAYYARQMPRSGCGVETIWCIGPWCSINDQIGEIVAVPRSSDVGNPEMQRLCVAAVDDDVACSAAQRRIRERAPLQSPLYDRHTAILIAITQPNVAMNQ